MEPIKLFSYSTIEEQVNITPIELNKDLDNIILEKLKSKLEGYCTQYGFIREVIKIENKEENPKLNDNGTGDCVIKVSIQVCCCLPKKGEIIECTISTDDKHSGVYISFEEPIFIAIIKEKNEGEEEEEIRPGDRVLVKIEKTNLKHRDTLVNIVSSYISKVK